MSTFSFRALIAVCVAVAVAVAVRAETPKAEPPAGPPKKLIVHPEAVALDGPRAAQRLGVLGEYADGGQWDLSRDARFTSGDAKVVTVDGQGIVRPAKDGQATVTVEAN